jgi:IgA Peptidase M64
MKRWLDWDDQEWAFVCFVIAVLLFICLVASLLWAIPAVAAPVTTVQHSGDSANRLDLAILGDGYTAAEMSMYAADVMNLLGPFFGQTPNAQYRTYMNVHRIDVISAQSGADHPESGVFVTTALDATYNCAGIQRLICVNRTTVNAILADSLPPASRDVVLVLVNDPQYGGSGGAIAVASTHPDVVELVLHELGHTLGLLADEYGGPPPPACNNTVEPPEPNATMASGVPFKWDHWWDGVTPLPTTTPGVTGLYQGAKYCNAEFYRPTANSKMRSLGAPFEAVNSEQLVRRLYNWVNPIDSHTPSQTELAVLVGQEVSFAVTTPQPIDHALDITWRVNGTVSASTPTFALDTATLGLGTHTIEVTVHDATALVREDSSNLLTATRTWTLQALPNDTATATTAVTATATTAVTGASLRVLLNAATFRPGETLTLTARLTPGPTPVVVDAYVVVRLPDGSFLSLQPGGVVAGVVPIGRGFAPFALTGEFLRYTFRGDEPPGQYTWFAALTEPGTLNVVSPLDQVPFTFSP